MTRTSTRHYEHHEIVWHGISLRATLAQPLRRLQPQYGHFDIEAIAPERTMLPITETGYRSHFTTAAIGDGCGAPVAFVLARLDEEAAAPAWQQHAAAVRQLTLF